jgi:23S rRNA (adenine2503-C2)-methyltransferase
VESICGLTKEVLAERLEAWALSLTTTKDPIREKKRAALRAKQIFTWIYKHHVTSFAQMTTLSKDLRAWLQRHYVIPSWEPKVARQALDGTYKVLWALQDGKTIESVVIPAALDGTSMKADSGLKGEALSIDPASKRWKRLTICISSQVGCAMKCAFCLTGIQGFDRHLQTSEIVTQVLMIRRQAPLTNIVFMGMGEPLHNYEAVVDACRIFLDADGLNFSKRKVTISTSGLVPKIRQLGQEMDVSLAISLNGSHDEMRSKVMPVNKKWNIQELLQACREYPLGSHRKITFEYVLMKGINDSDEDAKRLIGLLRSIPCMVNLIPFNPHPGSDFERPEDKRVFAFQRILLNAKMIALIRISRGQDILAACGQLRSLFGTAKGSEKHRDHAVTALPA